MSNPNCPICHGTNYIGYDVEYSDPRFGKMYPCPECFKNTWDPSIGIDGEEVSALDWDQFFPTESMKIMKPALVRILDKGYGWLYIHGNPGIGKTLAAKAATIIAHYKHHYQARYITHAGMINFLRSSYDEERGQGEYERRLRELSSIKWLVIDELGRDRLNDFSRSSLSDILDARYTDAIYKKSITILVSNFKPSEILDDYQQDRVHDKRFFVLELNDKSVRARATYSQAELSEQEEAWWQKL